MTPATDPFMAGVRPSGLQRGRGGFLRSADDAPYVSDPSGAMVQSGERKGKPCRLKYGSPSNRGREIENDAGLVKYKQRLSLAGIGMDPGLALACRDLAALPVGSPEFNTAADAIAVQADRLTRSSLAAERGTHGHLLTERWDRGEGWVNDIDAGIAVGLSLQTQHDVEAAWRDLLDDNGLEILAIEASCVDDKWRLAGTLDRIVRTTRPLTFVKSSGELVVIPGNTVLVLDIKFGKCRKAHPIQIASYAQSAPYDTETEVRGEWPFTIDQTHALIAHGDFGDDTRPVTIELVWVDLAAGRDHGGETVVQAKAWAARDDVFSVAQLDDNRIAEVAEALGPDVEGEEGAPFADLSPSTPLADAPDLTASATTGEDETCGKPATPPVILETDREITDDQAREIKRQWREEADRLPLVEGEAPPGYWGRDEQELPGMWDRSDLVGGATDMPDNGAHLTPYPDRLALVDARASLATEPTQGADLAEGYTELWDQLKAEFAALDDAARSWRGELVNAAQRHNVPFHVQEVRTERTYHLNRALISLASSGCDSDELLRAVLDLIVGEVALFPSIHPGHIVGSLTAKEAEQLAAFVDQFHAGEMKSSVDNDGTLRLTAA